MIPRPAHEIDADISSVGAYKLALRQQCGNHDWQKGVPARIADDLAAANRDLKNLLDEDAERQRLESLRRTR